MTASNIYDAREVKKIIQSGKSWIGYILIVNTFLRKRRVYKRVTINSVAEFYNLVNQQGRVTFFKDD